MKTWWLLYRAELGSMGYQKVYQYDQFYGKQLKRKLKAGWRVVE